MDRRAFLKDTVAGIGGWAVAAGATPLILTPRRTAARTQKGDVVFRPYYVQRGQGPHLGTVRSLQNLGETDWSFPQWAFASDREWDAFYSDIFATEAGVRISDTGGRSHFGINIRWNVEGFGFIYMTADNGGDFYTLPEKGATRTLNLNFELAKSRLVRTEKRLEHFMERGYLPSREVASFIDLSREYFEDAERADSEENRAHYAQKALYYGMWGGEMLELDKARKDIRRIGFREDFFVGCDTEGYEQMDADVFGDAFTGAFNYATITHYLRQFEPQERRYEWSMRDKLFGELRDRGVTVEGRPIFWADGCCTPDWLLEKDYAGLLNYLEQHTRDLVSHYGDEMYAWEVINEAHDPANVFGLRPEQMVEIAGFICDVARETNPNVHRLINNCCLQADYIQITDWSKVDRSMPLITPHQFIKMCHEAGVDFTISGQQLYFPYTHRDLADTIQMTERLQKYGRPVQITEIGATSGPTAETIASGTLPIPDRPYAWHRHWDPDLQADWLEQIYTILYAKPWIEAVNWYDFSDHFAFVEEGGLLNGPDGEPKPAYERLQALQERWRDL